MEPACLQEIENLRFRFRMNHRLRLESLSALSKAFREFGEPISDDLLSSLVFALPQELTGSGNGFVARGSELSAAPQPGLPPDAPQPGLPPDAPQPGLPPDAPQPGLPPDAPQPGLPPDAPQPGLPPDAPRPGLPPDAPGLPPDAPGLPPDYPKPGLPPDYPKPGLPPEPPPPPKTGYSADCSDAIA